MAKDRVQDSEERALFLVQIGLLTNLNADASRGNQTTQTVNPGCPRYLASAPSAS